MLERFSYTNNFNETLEFGKDYLFVNENDLRDFAWGINSKNDRISSFKKGIVSKTIPIILKCESEADGVTLRNRLFEVFEKDILSKQHGKLWVGDYYLRCFVTGSKKSEYLIHKNYMVVDLTVQTDFPEWIKETTTRHDLSPTSTGADLDYQYDFPHDYASNFTVDSITNTGLVPVNFIMKIYGVVVNPTIYIGDHRYSINVTVEENECLTIDSVKKTIVLTKADLRQENHFNNRDRDSYIFEKIPVGINVLSTNGREMSVEITLLEERSEPKWT